MIPSRASEERVPPERPGAGSPRGTSRTGEPPSPVQRRNTPGAIRRMFEAVAPGYDRMNRILSVGLDQGWRRAAIAELRAKPGSRVLDLCCGTGDLSLLLPEALRPVGCDFTPAMLEIAGQKAARRGARFEIVAGDALRLPFRAGVFGGVLIGFGVRNLPDLDVAFAEIRRVLDPEARLVLLEFSRPPGRLARWGHRAWLRHAVPRLARFSLSGTEPYGYLQESILDFPEAAEVAERLRRCGFGQVSFKYRSFGTVAIHTASPKAG